MSLTHPVQISILQEETVLRMDQLLARRFHDFSRTYFQNLISKGFVLLNGQPIKKRYKPHLNDTIEIKFAPFEQSTKLQPEAIPLEIIYEDEFLLAVNKPVGMVVHPAPGNWSKTFVNALLAHCQTLAETDECLRPGIVHRLDKDTSGIILAAKTNLAHMRLVQLFSERKMHKEYLAICLGHVKNGIIDTPIGRHPMHRKKMTVLEEKGKSAVTEISNLIYNGRLSKVKLLPKTGRTHQIRVHMQYNHTPILGDFVYGNSSMNQKFGAKRQYLHAEILAFNHPITGQYLELRAHVPNDMEEVFLCAF